MPLILETIVTTLNADGTPHLVPFGLIAEGEAYVIAPFRPSPTIANLERHPFLAAASPADVRVIAGCVTGRRDWATVPCDAIEGVRLAQAYAHMELAVDTVLDDAVRPRFVCRLVHQATHAPFPGYVRARNAVIEAAILSTRLHLLAPEKIEAEMAYLAIAIAKTAGPAELEAWSWIERKIKAGAGIPVPGRHAEEGPPSPAGPQEKETSR